MAVMTELENTDGAVLFIDEIHTVIGAGATSGGSMDASNISSLHFRAARSSAWALPPIKSTEITLKRIVPWCAASKRLMYMSHLSRTQ